MVLGLGLVGFFRTLLGLSLDFAVALGLGFMAVIWELDFELGVFNLG